MQHHILVKFTQEAGDKPCLIARIRELFAAAPQIPGITDVQIRENCIDRPNRYDLLIVLHMEEAALPIWDESSLHKRWKSEFGVYVAQKAIFDCR